MKAGQPLKDKNRFACRCFRAFILGMARLLRVEYAGAIHHVTIRGNGRQEIFLDDRDRARFLVRLSQSVELHQVRLYLFCQMSNHVLCGAPHKT